MTRWKVWRSSTTATWFALPWENVPWETWTAAAYNGFDTWREAFDYADRMARS